MSLTLYYHPLSSFCWKALIALYENEAPFTPLLIDFGNEKSLAELLKVWPMGEFPVLRDDKKQGRIIPQSSTIIEYLHLYYPGANSLIPADADRALEARRWDGFYDDYVHQNMQKIVADTFRPAGQKDVIGVGEARETMRSAYDLLEKRFAHQFDDKKKSGFTIEDCSACPALFYGNMLEPFGNNRPHLTAYLEHLKQRPSFARVLKEAEPYFHMVPKA